MEKLKAKVCHLIETKKEASKFVNEMDELKS